MDNGMQGKYRRIETRLDLLLAGHFFASLLPEHDFYEPYLTLEPAGRMRIRHVLHATAFSCKFGMSEQSVVSPPLRGQALENYLVGRPWTFRSVRCMNRDTTEVTGPIHNEEFL